MTTVRWCLHYLGVDDEVHEAELGELIGKCHTNSMLAALVLLMLLMMLLLLLVWALVVAGFE